MDTDIMSRSGVKCPCFISWRPLPVGPKIRWAPQLGARRSSFLIHLIMGDTFLVNADRKDTTQVELNDPELESDTRSLSGESPSNPNWTTTRRELWCFYLYYIVRHHGFRLNTVLSSPSDMILMIRRATMAFLGSILALRSSKICCI